MARPLLLAGSLVHTDDVVEVRAPFDGRVVAEVCIADVPRADFAALAAAGGFAATRRMPAHTRAAILRATAAGVALRRAELVAVLRDEGGKPVRFGRDEVDRAIRTLELCAAEALRIDGAVLPMHTGAPVTLKRCFPRGPVLALTLVNFPLLSVAQRVGPAVAAGCPIVIRPALQAPTAALLLGKALVEAGWIESAISVLPCDKPVTDALVTDPHFATLCYTGSGRAGWNVRARAGRKHLVVDSGEAANAIVESDADLEQALPRVAEGAFAHAGQACATVQRIFVHSSIYEEARARLVDATQRVGHGDPAEDDVVCGPMIDGRRRARVEAWMAGAEASGARCLAGGDRVGSVLTPAVMEAPSTGWRSHTRECSGPVAMLERYESLDEAIDLINDAPGTQETGLFTQTLSRLWHVFDRLDAGSLVHDAWPTQRPATPVEDEPNRSLRNRPRVTIEEMTEIRTLVLRNV